MSIARSQVHEDLHPQHVPRSKSRKIKRRSCWGGDQARCACVCPQALPPAAVPETQETDVSHRSTVQSASLWARMSCCAITAAIAVLAAGGNRTGGTGPAAGSGRID
ncbi:hypothetical protein C0Q70_20687 [Pomacea canaliculata]|uniref:Uncharacterized protein n=1 Tax=Pomacea canaliculata TaxID=400727 RepID=A0A2T7NG92_POMCA|nr:hypothetical protein C0Q70_20687 [Pomacea canaliculata]